MEADNGELLEADLEEIYYYQIKNTLNQRNGFAIQRVYNQDRSLDETIVVHDHDIVLIPEGYHPVCAAEGYDCYYLNFLAGSAQSLACTDDPDYAWIKDSWTWKDPRVPLVKLKEQVPV
jgi:5-deoxy-glucuronate isomerase